MELSRKFVVRCLALLHRLHFISSTSPKFGTFPLCLINIKRLPRSFSRCNVWTNFYTSSLAEIHSRDRFPNSIPMYSSKYKPKEITHPPTLTHSTLSLFSFVKEKRHNGDFSSGWHWNNSISRISCQYKVKKSIR